MIRLYNFQGSGNSYKVRLLLTQLQVPFERIDIDLLAGETGKPGFRARNPLGQTPFIELDDGGVLAESNAILWSPRAPRFCRKTGGPERRSCSG